MEYVLKLCKLNVSISCEGSEFGKKKFKRIKKCKIEPSSMCVEILVKFCMSLLNKNQLTGNFLSDVVDFKRNE